jgi:hypothetical protein
MKWVALGGTIGVVSIVVRVVNGEARSGQFMRRLTMATKVGPRLTSKAPAVSIPLESYVKREVALWLVPEGDGLYLRDMCGVTDQAELVRMRAGGALDARD